MCDKVVDTHPSTTEFVPECCKALETCYKAVNRYFLYLILFLININLKKCVHSCFFMCFFNNILP